MRRLLLWIQLLVLSISGPAFSQQGWVRVFGYPNGAEEGQAVWELPGGGYAIAGHTSSIGAGMYDGFLLRINAAGDTLRTKTYGGRGNENWDSILWTPDGSYLFGGYATSFGAGNFDVWLAKTDSSGETLWTKTYGRTRSDGYPGTCTQPTSDGGYVVVGTTTSFGDTLGDIWLVKTNASGDSLWTKTYGGPRADQGWSVQQTSDGGYIIAGQSYSFGPGTPTYPNVYLIKTNASGDTTWTKTFGGARSDCGRCVRQTPDGGYILAGYTASFGAGSYDVYLIKTNPSGDTLWTRTYGGSREDRCGDFASVQLTSDGGYIVTGLTFSFGAGDRDAYLIKTDANGSIIWTKTFGSTVGDEGNCVIQTSDEGYLVVGPTFRNGTEDVFIIKTDADGGTGTEETAAGRDQRLEGRIAAEPNPFTSSTRVVGHEGEAFLLCDVSGRKVVSYKGNRIGEGLAPGVYFLRSSDDKDKPLRIVKVR